MLRHPAQLLQRTRTTAVRPSNLWFQHHRGFVTRSVPPLAKKFAPQKGRSAHRAQTEKLPLLSASLRTFFRKVHPDLLSKHPEQREHNEVNVTNFRSLLDAISDKSHSDWPAAGKHEFNFYVRKATNEDEFELVTLRIITTGGIAKKPFETALSRFFVQLGIGGEEGKFRWDDEYWPNKDVLVYEKDDDEEEKY
eukprot:g10334.t1